MVVKDVHLAVSAGEVVGLLGPNGAGKTTTFYMVVGLVRADAGVIEIDGQPVHELPIHQRSRLGLSYLPQEASIFRKLTVEENVRAVLELQVDDRRPRAVASRSSTSSCSGLLHDLGDREAARLAGAGAVGRRAAARRDRARAGHAAALHPARRALRRHRPDRGDRDPAHHQLPARCAASACSSPTTTCARRWASATAPTSSATARCWPRARPQQIVDNAEVRKVYLGEHFRM